MTTFASADVSLTETDFQLIRHALETRLMDYGHDEDDVVHDLHELWFKLRTAHDVLVSVTR